MEVKRRRVDEKLMDYVKAERSLNSANLSEIRDALLYLKEKLTSRVEAVSFLDTHRQCFITLLALFQKNCAEYLSSITGCDAQLQTALCETISVLANVCHFSVTACAEVSKWPNIGSQFQHLIDSVASERIKANVLRLLGNLCNFSETSTLVASNQTLLDSIATIIKEGDTLTADRSLRVIRLLANRSPSHLRAIIRSNCTYYIGKRILGIGSSSAVKGRQDILQVLLNFLRVYPKDVGRQLGESGCSQILLDIFLEDEDEAFSTDKNVPVDAASPFSSNPSECSFPPKAAKASSPSALWRTFLLKLTRHSYEIREAFGREAINRTIAAKDINGFRCELLCLFAQDAWSRMILRESNALVRLLDLLEAPECSARQQMKIIASLKHFIYDTQSMAYLCQRAGFVRIATAHIRRYVDEHRAECRRIASKFASNSTTVEPTCASASKEEDKSCTLSVLPSKCTPIKRDFKQAQLGPPAFSGDFVASPISKSSLIKSQSSGVLSAPFQTQSSSAVTQSAVSPKRNEVDVSPLPEIFNDILPQSGGAMSPSSSGLRFSPSVFTYNRWIWSPSMSPTNSGYDYAPPPVSEGLCPPSLTLERSAQDERYLFDDSVAAAAILMSDEPASMCYKEDEEMEQLLTQDIFSTRPADSNASETQQPPSPGKAGIPLSSAENVAESANEKLDAHTRNLVVADCLDIISKLTHQEENYPYLVKEEVLRTLIDYVSDAPVFDPRLVRSLKRLARSRGCLQILLEMNFHRMVITKLIRRKCILSRFSKFCRRCDRCREFGCDLISEFAGHADSNMGWYHLQIDLQKDATAVRNALITGLMLIRSSDRVQRFYTNHMPIEMLLLDLAQILGGEWVCKNPPPKRIPTATTSSLLSVDVDNENNFDVESEQGQLCCDIMMAFSSLITRRNLRNFFEMGLKFEAPKGCENDVEKRCGLYEVNTNEEADKNAWKCACRLERLMQKLSEIKGKLTDSADLKADGCSDGITSQNVECEVIQVGESQQIKAEMDDGNNLENVEVKVEFVGDDHGSVELPDSLTSTSTDTLEFYNANDVEKGAILVVPKEELCATNPYFQGMFDHEFVENVEGWFKFMFDENEDHCDEADFVKFLHYLVGCRDSECVSVRSAQTCVALIHLSDKYLCTALTAELIQEGGRARTLMNGENLRLFVPLMLTIPVVMDALASTWAFVLLRYSTPEQTLATLDYFRGDAPAVGWLLETLQRFLVTCADKKTVHQASAAVAPLWDI